MKRIRAALQSYKEWVKAVSDDDAEGVIKGGEVRPVPSATIIQPFPVKKPK